MGRSPVRLKEVVYGVSSNKVEIMGSLARDALSATTKKIEGGWFDVTVFGIAPLVGTVMCVFRVVVVFVVVFFYARGRSRVASSPRFCLSLLSFGATSIGATGSGKVRQSPRARSHLCRSNRGLNRKSLTVNISLSLSLSLEQVRGELQRTRETRPQILNNNARRRRRNSARVYLCIVYKNVAVVKACKEHSKTASRARTKRHLE